MSGETGQIVPLFILMETVNSRGPTSLTTSPGPPTPRLLLRRHSSICISWECFHKKHLNVKLLVASYRSTTELHHGAVCRLLSCRQKGSSKGQKHNRENHSLPTDIANSCDLSRAEDTVKYCSHPCHYRFELLPFGRHYRSLKNWTTRLVSQPVIA